MLQSHTHTVRPLQSPSAPYREAAKLFSSATMKRLQPERVKVQASVRFLGYEVSIHQLIKDIEWIEGPRRWGGLRSGHARRIERPLPWYTGLQDAWQEVQQGTSDFCSWHLQHLRQHMQQSWHHLQLRAPHWHEQLLQQLQHVEPGAAIAVAVLFVVVAAAVSAVFRERRRRAVRRQRTAQQRAENARSLSLQADRFRRALGQFGGEEPSSGRAPPRPDHWHPDPSAEPALEPASYRSRHAGESDVAFLSTWDSDMLLQHYTEADADRGADDGSAKSAAQAASGQLPSESSPDAPQGTNSQDWDEQARTEWKAFLRKSKMFQVPEDGWWDAEHSDEPMPPVQPLQTLDYNA